jgi:Leucine-rich repeat (LRR) protein
MFIELVDNGLEGVFDVEQYCIDNNIDAEKVTSLDCSYNILTELKSLDKLVNLDWLDCSDNKLSEIKGLDKLVNLEYLYCEYNPLSELDVSNLVNLKTLDCHNNKLTELDTSNLVNLNWLNDKEYMQPEPEQYKLDLILSKIEKLEQIILNNKR